jgi:glutamate 5-kinase
MQAWQQAFASHQIKVAQLLLTLDDSEQRRRYLNARATFSTLLQHKLIPIVNENDTVATAELKFGDNDRLAARVAGMVSADILVLFSDIDGLYDSDPRKNAAAKLLPRIDAITPEIMAMGGGAASGFSNGGMKTKLEAASMAVGAGCHMAIARGDTNHPLKTLMEGGKASWFVAATKPQVARKHWIAASVAARGAIIVDDGAATALASGKSLLPAGVTSIEGSFERGDTVAIKNLGGTVLARGITAYGSAEAAKIAGQKTSEIAAILGYTGRDTLIHRDDLAML